MTTHTLTEPALRHLAALIETERPHWNPTGIWNALLDANQQNQTPFRLTLAALTAAATPTCETPASIPHNGPWWHTGQPEKDRPTPTPPRIEDPDLCTICYRHEGMHAEWSGHPFTTVESEAVSRELRRRLDAEVAAESLARCRRVAEDARNANALRQALEPGINPIPSKELPHG